MKLLGPGDPPPFRWHLPEGKAPILFFCDHAGRAFPTALGSLGLGPADLEKHIAWDIGVADLAQSLGSRMDAPVLLASYSRLVIDCNRRLDDPSSIAQVSDGIVIPGNCGLTGPDRRLRADEIFSPYHAALHDKIQSKQKAGLLALISLHSFTPQMNGFPRPWHIGILWNEDDRIVKPLAAALAAEGDLCIGDNQPYSGRDRHGYSIEVHGEGNDLPHVLLEIRQDLIDTPAKAHHWAARLGNVLKKVLA